MQGNYPQDENVYIPANPFKFAFWHALKKNPWQQHRLHACMHGKQVCQIQSDAHTIQSLNCTVGIAQ